MRQFDQFDKATIKKEFYKNNIKYLELQYTDEETNKIYLIKISYKRYILQKYLGYLIPKEHHIISLDGNEENYDVYNLGIRDEDNESPVYKGYRVQGEYRKTKAITVHVTNGKNTVSRSKQVYIYEKVFGRRLLTSERVIFKKAPFIDYTIANLQIINRNLKSDIYKHETVRKPHYKKGRLYVNIVDREKNTISMSYPKFLMQEHLGRKLEDNEYIKLKEPDNFDITNMEVKTIKYLTTKLYQNVKTVTGPYYKSRKNKIYERQRITILFKDGSYKDIAYPRFILQEHLGRFLTENETVHHKDGDYYNNEIDNLEILSRAEHILLDCVRLKQKTLICQICGGKINLDSRKWWKELKKMQNNPKYIGPFCNINCTITAKRQPELYQNILPKKEYFNYSKTYEFDKYFF